DELLLAGSCVTDNFWWCCWGSSGFIPKFGFPGNNDKAKMSEKRIWRIIIITAIRVDLVCYVVAIEVLLKCESVKSGLANFVFGADAKNLDWISMGCFPFVNSIIKEELVESTVNKNDLIYWFVSDLKESCHSKVMPLSFMSQNGCDGYEKNIY
ncbi:20979_t:CDS:2, partial [Dentiscutata erythropus]